MAGSKRIAWTPEEDKLLKENYGKVTSKELVALIPTHSSGSIRARADYFRKKGDAEIPEKQEKRKYDVNFGFFDEIGLEQCAFAGLVASDGCIKPKKNLVQVSLKDYDYLREWANVIGYTGPVHTYDIAEGQIGHGQISVLLVHGVPRWLDVLYKIFNVTPKKSLTLSPPNLTNREQILAYRNSLV